VEALLPFLERYEAWIYALLGIVAFIYLQKLVTSWKEWQGTVFGLERDSAQRRFSTSLTILFLLVLFVVVEFVIVSFVSPNYPQTAFLATPTLDVLATPTVTLPALVQGAQAGTPPAGSFTQTETPPAIPLELRQEGCIVGQIEWISPKAGDTISATVELTGTVNVPNLGFYKYEYARPGEDLWTTIAGGNQPKVNGQIGFWNTTQLDQGDYLLRLVIADNANNLFPACIIPVRVVRQ
jgi:hypothetical protein